MRILQILKRKILVGNWINIYRFVRATSLDYSEDLFPNGNHGNFFVRNKKTN